MKPPEIYAEAEKYAREKQKRATHKPSGKR
jgi:hypothetical protein